MTAQFWEGKGGGGGGGGGKEKKHRGKGLGAWEKGVFFSTRALFLDRFKSHPPVAGNRSHSFGAHDLEALMNLALDAKQWITTHAIGV
jgi:hypothetical protein